MPPDDDPTKRHQARCRDAARQRVPLEFRDAQASDPDVAGWVRQVLAAWWPGWPSDPASPFAPEPWLVHEPPMRVPALLLTGRAGTGKTWQAYGALLAVAGTGIKMSWEAARVADLLAEMQPRPDVASWDVFRKYADAGLLLLDDIGAMKGSPWAETTLDRLADWRWSRWLPTIWTTNLPVWTDPDLAGRQDTLESTLSARLFSRLAGSVIVTTEGPDRRQPPPEGGP